MQYEKRSLTIQHDFWALIWEFKTSKNKQRALKSKAGRNKNTKWLKKTEKGWVFVKWGLEQAEPVIELPMNYNFK